MIKCHFVDIKDIRSDVPRSSFIKSDLEQLADSILATDGLIQPLIIKSSGGEKYIVIAGHREYYAALIAKERDSKRAEMVNAFVIDPNIHSAAVDQLKLLKEDFDPVIASDPMPSGIEQFLPILSAAISEQVKPLVAQLAEQKQMLEALMIDRIAPVDVPLIITPPPPPESKNIQPTLITPIIIEPKPPKAPKVKVEKVRQQTSKISKITTAPENIQPTPTDVIVVKAKTPRAPKATTKKSTKVATLPESSLQGRGSANDPIKATNTLNLINTSNQKELEFSMQRSGLTKTVTNLVPSILASRDSQPNQKFDTWETILSIKIKGLTTAVVKGIIEKLK